MMIDEHQVSFEDMRRKGLISDEIIQSIDITNTLNGGVSEPVIKISQHQDYRQIELKVPGMTEESMHVKINNNQLVVYFEHAIESRGETIYIPHIAYNKPIPYFIDVKNIRAQYSEGVLTVQLPFNELANGYQRDIPIGN
jgi:HSP20 family molecular chaperone IbpA